MCLSTNSWRLKQRSVAAGFGRHGMLRPPLMTQVLLQWLCHDDRWQHHRHCRDYYYYYYYYYCILFPELGRGRDETYRRCELMTLAFDLWLMRVVVLHPGTKFEVRRPWHSENMAHDVCQSGDLERWPFDVETGVRVASKLGNLLCRFRHAGLLGSRIIRYVRDLRTDRRTDRQTDKSNAYCPFPIVGGIMRTAIALCCRQAMKHKSCVDMIVCTKSDELYQAALANRGLANAYLHLCGDDTGPGCTHSAF